jgi:hypothetical protein
MLSHSASSSDADLDAANCRPPSERSPARAIRVRRDAGFIWMASGLQQVAAAWTASRRLKFK